MTPNISIRLLKSFTKMCDCDLPPRKPPQEFDFRGEEGYRPTLSYIYSEPPTPSPCQTYCLLGYAVTSRGLPLPPRPAPDRQRGGLLLAGKERRPRVGRLLVEAGLRTALFTPRRHRQ